MKVIALSSLATAALLAACAAPEATQSFSSRQEQVCYERTSAALAPGRELRRGPDGTFVEVTVVNDFMRDVERSEAFDACMTATRPAGSTGDMAPVTFTGEELTIWRSLTDTARAQALEFIRNGGTLREFVAQG
ncbi:hypothetical protein HMH01_00570 [Halovulum dunhuangense]|uniref:Lipoprotein n=1 Tax=Halovulum dunhuangense TaxID=1505036 RepID=A0A849KUF3_9RHOB|nr:hypothetical protein [Halovulum dunhuangense]NNU78918.1 hypothetical protein [Halovulum dunhuangense]